MKRLLILLSLLFCNVVFADTITINWGVDNQQYTTTTCEIGGDVVLPSVSKRGHIFRGWTPEHFNRGTFANWGAVPTSDVLYFPDYHETRTPRNGDYIIIEDASDYVYSFKSFVSYKKISTWDVFINGTKLQENGVANEIDGITFRFFRNSGLSCDSIMVINGVQYSPGTIYRDYGNYSYGNINNPTTIQSDDGQLKNNGTWRFVYSGVWEVDGKNGWKPDVQISNE